MAPVLDQASSLLQPRSFCPAGEHLVGNDCIRGDPWFWYGRWILLAVLLVFVFLLLFTYACLQSRRRRRQGMSPMYGTGWMAPNNGQYYNPPQAYNSEAYHQPPPAYGAPGQSYPMDNRYQTADGQYNRQASGVEPPKNVYSGDYAPPAGPPPNK
ncbi:chitin synthesis regulation, resistance to congo red-domain-containing protein [Xylaria intraflava]|nr:chitin synthesis regulation, resistance to congo red-domain-containing protein [Xylaria intraflava]